MKKHSLVIPLLLVLSLVLPQSTPLLAAETLAVVFDPPTVAPGEKFIAHAKGFVPQGTVSITYKGAATGVDLYFNETQKKADATGSVDFTGSVSELDNGTLSFDFKDEAGNTTTATVTIQGKAPRPFLFGPQVEVTVENIQVGLTGVGWTGGKKKSLKAIGPDEQPSAPQFFDLCEGAACPEREDGLKLIAVFPRSTPSGSHTLIVSEEGGTDVRTTVVIPELPENKKEAGREAEIFLIDPPAATVDVSQIYVRGSGWGPYDDRRFVKAWLVDPDTKDFYELKVAANYRDCSFMTGGQKISGKCLLEADEMFLRLEIPEAVKPALTPKKYLLFVQSEKNVHGGGTFTIMAKPVFDQKKGASIAVIPDRGPVGTSTLLFGAGFPKKQFIDVHFDGVYVKLGGALWPNDDGTFENIPFQIPRTLMRNGKETKVEAGTHTISLSAKDASASTKFIVEGPTDAKKKKEEEERLKKEEELKKKKEQEERDRIEKEQKKLKEEQDKIKKEEERLEKERKKLEEELKKKKEEEKEQKETDKDDKERLEKERKKLEEELKKKKEEEQKKEKQLEDTKDKKEKLDDRFCDPDLPLTFQPGCVQKKTAPQKSEYEGKPCRADMAITFQPGCVGQKPDEQKQLFVGKPCTSDLPITFQPGCVSQPRADLAQPFTGKACDSNLPRVWQEGCVDEKEKQKEQKPTVQYYTPDSTGKACKEGVAITFQPGCVSQPKEKPAGASTQNPFKGKQCDPKLPRVWQEGCVDASEKAADQNPQAQLYAPDSAGKPCKEGLAITFQPGCVSQTKETPAAASTQNPFKGKLCDSRLPRVWQEGCVDASGKTTPGEQQTQTQAQATVTIKEKEAPICNPQIPTYTQSGCRKE